MKNSSLSLFKKLAAVAIIFCMTGMGAFAQVEKIVSLSSTQNLSTALNALAIDLNTITKLSVINNTDGEVLTVNDFAKLNGMKALLELDLSGDEKTTELPNDAFSKNQYIKTVKFPVNMNNIGTGVFNESKLEGIVSFPKSLIMSNWVNKFNNCQGITGFEFPDNTRLYSYDAEGNKCQTGGDGVIYTTYDDKRIALLRYPCGKTDMEYTIPEGVAVIAQQVFYNNYKLQILNLPSTLKTFDGTTPRDAIFRNATAFKAINVAEGNTAFVSMSGVLADISKKELLYCPPMLAGEVIIDGSYVQTTPSFRFFGTAANMSKIVFTEGFTTIPNDGIRMNASENLQDGSQALQEVYFPSTLTNIGSGAFVRRGNVNLIVCRAKTPPTLGGNAFFNMGDNVKDQIKIYVPAGSLTAYTSTSPVWGNQNNSFTATKFVGFYNVIISGGIASSPINYEVTANTIAAAGQTITITAEDAPEGHIFDKWVVSERSVDIADATQSSTTLIMPDKDVEITATYKSTDKMENTGTTKDAVFIGKWNEATFNAFILENAVNLTTIDLTGITGLTKVPVIVNLNPNCLIYVNNGVTGNVGQNLISFDGTAYTGDVILVEATDAVKNNSFNNKHAFTGNISYTRDFSNAPGQYATICLPFEVTNPTELTGLEFEEFDKVTIDDVNAFLNFTTIEAGALKANIPYIIKIAPETSTVTFKGATVAETSIANPPVSEGYSFKGNFNYTTDVANYYLLCTDGSEFAKASESSYITAFRAYLTVTGENSRKLTVGHNGGATRLGTAQQANGLSIHAENGIIYINAGNTQVINVYSVDGRIVKTMQLNEGSNAIAGLAKGIYLINQQKVTN